MIEKELQHTNDPVTVQKLNELLHNVKEVLSTLYSQEKIQQKVLAEVEALWPQNSLAEEAEEELKRLQQSCLGVVHSLNEKDFRLDNLFLRNLLAQVETTHPAQTMRIKHVLHQITLKSQ